MRAVILGGNGQLGRELRRRHPDAIAPTRDELDLADVASVLGYDWSGADVVLNAAAWTAVDAAEDPGNLTTVQAVNSSAVSALAALSADVGFVLVHISSEYVFDGSYVGPIPEDLPFSPLSVYGRSKADGDRRVMATERHYLVRTTWVVGEGRNFVATMADLADRGVLPSVVDDQIGRPTFTADLAAGIDHLLRSGAPFGTYNLTSGGDPVSWADVASSVFAIKGRAATDVRRVTTEEYFSGRSGVAVRPRNSVLDLNKITRTGFDVQDWRVRLDAYLGRRP